VKTLVISMLILLIALFGLIPAFGQPSEDETPQLKEQKEQPTKELEHKNIVDANASADPNTVRAKIKEFEGLNKALEQINKEGKDEIREWTRSRTEDKLDLALAVQKQIIVEFNFLREIAVEERAVKTTAAINKMLLDRQERFKDVIEKLEKERERLHRRSEREERRGKEEQERGRERRERSRERVDRNK
jgi:hypothetical protein